MGLFAEERVGHGVTIGEYSGDVVDSLVKWLRLRNAEYLALTEDRSISIDGRRHPEMLMRYVNHHPSEKAVNIRFRSEGTRVFLETTKPVGAGEEFFADYGDMYWLLLGIMPHAP